MVPGKDGGIDGGAPAMRLMFLTGLATFALDQVLKFWIVVWIDLPRQGSLDVWPPFLNLRMAWNRGVNFGLLASDSEWGRWILVAIAVGISAGIAWWLRSAPRPATRFCAGLVIGGALGNALDRVIYGAVADFLNMSCCGIDNPFSFNVADIAIFAGVAGLIVLPDGAHGGSDKGRDPASRLG
jgi:signal peptidase II